MLLPGMASLKTRPMKRPFALILSPSTWAMVLPTSALLVGAWSTKPALNDGPTAAIGKLGPTLIFDHTDRADRPGHHSVVIDDSTGAKNGVPLSDEMKAALTKANLPLAAPSRGDNGKAGDAKTAGTVVPN